MSDKAFLLERPPLDEPLLIGVLGILLLGLVMVGSASIGIATDHSGNPFYFLIRQGIYVGLGLALAWQALRLPLRFWEQSGPYLLLFSMVLLVLVLVPGLGRNVNGSSRWLGVGPLTLQPSELVKLFSIVYLAGYVVRRGQEVRQSVWGFVKPLLVLGFIAFLLLLEPDFGTSVVVLTTSMGVLFLAGVRIWQFVVLLIPVMLGLMGLAVVAPYRLQRVLSFLDPWQDAFGKGYQLTQALIAFGRGEWLGVGLGGSIQKLHYLPEAHTDFLFAVLAEELGLVGILVVVGLFSFVIWRAFEVGRRAEEAQNFFAAYLCYGISLWIGFQAFINIGVNMGILPTKGLTLPLMSYGGSSVMITCVAMSLLLRVSGELHAAEEIRKSDPES
ncbi:putative peptidoglycan glycosyltransferase FtsW [Gammaproteobacteria bacterium]